jgi:hypothetical protein
MGGRRHRWLRGFLVLGAGVVLVLATVSAVLLHAHIRAGDPPDPTTVGDDAAQYALVHGVPLASTKAIVDYCNLAATQADAAYQQTDLSYGDAVDDGCVTMLVADLRH